MIIDKFKFEDKDYIIELQDSDFIVFYREKPDSFSFFSDPIPESRVTNDINKPIRLLRMIAEKIKHFLYQKQTKYFYLTVDDDKRKRLYIKFLNNLSGYNYQVSDNTINVFRNNEL